jgi:hypothetical protein
MLPRKYFSFLLLCLFGVPILLQAQQLKLGKNPSVNLKSAVLELQSDNQGLLMARISDTALINTLTPPDGMVIFFIPTKQLMVRSNGYWQILVQSSSLGSSWLTAGNTGINASTNFLGTTDDKPLILKSNNSAYAEFGRRQTLGLTQTYTDYSDNDEQVLHLKSALQFYAPSASFYKPKIFVDANGNFRTKGSSAGTDYFEFGATGTNNNGGFEFIIGDDGDEPIVFKSYNYLTGMSEMMRLQSGRMAVGSNAFNVSNPEKLLIDAGTTDSYNLMTGKGSIDNYLQINVQNRSSGTNASSDLVATADNGDEGSNFIDMGINSSNYSNASYPILSGINNAYLYTTGKDFVLGNGTSTKSLRFFTGGFNNANERLRIDGTGNVGINNLAPTEKMDITGNVRFSGALMPNNIAGTAGYLLQSNGAATAPTWINGSSLISGAAWTLDGNSLTAIKKLGTISNHDLPFITNNTEQMRLTTTGFLGMGTTTPAGRLHFVNDNSEYGNDYLFDDFGTSTSQGFFIRRGRGTIAAPLNIANGDAIGAINFTGRINGAFNYSAGTSFSAYYKGTGTNDLSDLRLLTSSTERMRIDENGNVGIGATSFDATFPEKLLINAGTTTSVNAIHAIGSINKYFQINVQNLSNGTSSSADIVATANNGTETNNYVDLGINGQYFAPVIGDISTANDGYLISSGNDFYLINNNASKDVIVLTGGTTASNEAMRITSAGRVGIGASAPIAKLDAAGTFKLGTTGTVNKNQINFASTLATSTVTAGSVNTITSTFTSGVKDITITIPAATQPSTSQGTVVVTPNFDLPTNVSIAFARLISATQIRVRFINSGTGTQTIVGTLYCSVTEF